MVQHTYRGCISSGFSTFESLRVLVCALGGRIDLSPGSSREIGASGEGGLRHEDALRDDDDEEEDDGGAALSDDEQDQVKKT